MDKTRQQFLQAVERGIHGEKTVWTEAVDVDGLYALANHHRLLPLIYDTAPAEGYRTQAVQAMAVQAMKTADFLKLYGALEQAGLHPLVVKGLICRSLYPNPDVRPSSDEDVLIPGAEFARCVETMQGLGMVAQREDGYEVPLRRPDGPLYIELHRQLFPPDDAFGDMNRFFENAFDRAVVLSVEGQTVRTLCPTDFLLYLICHALKHFVAGGVGIRQMCDIALFAQKYGREIDYDYVLARCQAVRGERFAVAVFAIAEQYLGFDREQAGLTARWRAIPTDSAGLLADTLEAGIYGQDRRHSANMTNEALAAHNRGRGGRPLGKALFPGMEVLKNRFPYLRKYPWLLPAAWTFRLVDYLRKGRTGRDWKMGQARIQLLRDYGILD